MENLSLEIYLCFLDAQIVLCVLYFYYILYLEKKNPLRRM